MSKTTVYITATYGWESAECLFVLRGNWSDESLRKFITRRRPWKSVSSAYVTRGRTESQPFEKEINAAAASERAARDAADAAYRNSTFGVLRAALRADIPADVTGATRRSRLNRIDKKIDSALQRIDIEL